MKSKIIFYKNVQHHVPVGLRVAAIAQKAQLDELRLDQRGIKPRTHGNVVLISKISFGVCWWPTTGAHLRPPS